MDGHYPDSTVRPLLPRLDELQARIADLAAQSKVGLSSHARTRMVERDIDLLSIIRVLQRGVIEGGITQGQNAGEWKCKVVGRISGDSREIGVVVIVVSPSDRLFVKTVEWEDL